MGLVVIIFYLPFLAAGVAVCTSFPGMRKPVALCLLAALPAAYLLGALETQATGPERTWFRVCAYPFLTAGFCLGYGLFRLAHRILKR